MFNCKIDSEARAEHGRWEMVGDEVRSKESTNSLLAFAPSSSYIFLQVLGEKVKI